MVLLDSEARQAASEAPLCFDIVDIMFFVNSSMILLDFDVWEG